MNDKPVMFSVSYAHADASLLQHREWIKSLKQGIQADISRMIALEIDAEVANKDIGGDKDQRAKACIEIESKLQVRRKKLAKKIRALAKLSYAENSYRKWKKIQEYKDEAAYADRDRSR